MDALAGAGVAGRPAAEGVPASLVETGLPAGPAGFELGFFWKEATILIVAASSW